jgi:Uma2 family endonuclease
LYAPPFIPPASDEHDDLDLWLSTLIRMFIEEHDLGVIRHNIFVRFASQRRRRVPDLFFVRSDRVGLLKPTYLDGSPDLIIEIISPDSQSRDRREKYRDYEKAGVREYWIIDPLSKTVEAYALDGRKFRLIEEDADGGIRSMALANFRLKPEWLWRRPLPKVATILKQMRSRSPRR